MSWELVSIILATYCLSEILFRCSWQEKAEAWRELAKKQAALLEKICTDMEELPRQLARRWAERN